MNYFEETVAGVSRVGVWLIRKNGEPGEALDTRKKVSL